MTVPMGPSTGSMPTQKAPRREVVNSPEGTKRWLIGASPGVMTPTPLPEVV